MKNCPYTNRKSKPDITPKPGNGKFSTEDKKID